MLYQSGRGMGIRESLEGGTLWEIRDFVVGSKDLKGIRLLSSWEQKPTGLKGYDELLNMKNDNPIDIGKRITELTSDLQMLETAYRKNKETLDDISLKNLAKEIATGQFKFIPNRTVEIPNVNGKIIKLGLASPKDKIVQDVIKMILEAVYIKDFKETSHGYIKGRSCHTALNLIKMKFGAVNWFIEADIKTCFDSFEHKKLLVEVEKKIKSQIFMDLLRKALKVGYIDLNVIISDHIISPILLNIYLHNLDEFMENIGKDERQIYVRYADAFIIGVIGSKKDCEEIKTKVKEYLENKLALKLSEENIKIKHATTSYARFLETDIRISPNIYKGEYLKKPLLLAPINMIVDKLKDKGMVKGVGNNPTRVGKWTNLTHEQIIKKYLLVARSILNYYIFVNNYARLRARVLYIIKYSCALTLGSKLRIKTLNQTFNKFGNSLKGKDMPGFDDNIFIKNKRLLRLTGSDKDKIWR